MMRKILLIFSLVFSVIFLAQTGSNVFSDQSEINSNKKIDNPSTSLDNSSYMQSNKGAGNDMSTMGNGKGNNGNGKGNGGNPGDPVPIDNYIPIFILVATGIILYKRRSLAKA